MEEEGRADHFGDHVAHHSAGLSNHANELAASCRLSYRLTRTNLNTRERFIFKAAAGMALSLLFARRLPKYVAFLALKNW
jgi:hypothetical protein